MRAMYSLTVVNPAEYIPHIGDLLARNWGETGFDFPFNPNIEAYQALYEAGMIFAIAAINTVGVAGYCTVSITPHLHNPEIIVAANDALFVDKPHRRGTLGARIIVAAEKEAKARGAGRFIWHCRAGTGLAKTLCKHGYDEVDNIVMKEM